MTSGNGTTQRILTLEEEMRVQRERSHLYGNKITEQGSHIEDIREDVKEIKKDTKEQLAALRKEMDKHFDDIGARFWKASALIISAMAVAVTVLK